MTPAIPHIFPPAHQSAPVGQGESPIVRRGERVERGGGWIGGGLPDPAVAPDRRCRRVLGGRVGETGRERCGAAGVQLRMPRTADPHHTFSRAALAVAVAIAVFWTWKVLVVVLEHIRGDVGP